MFKKVAISFLLVILFALQTDSTGFGFGERSSSVVASDFVQRAGDKLVVNNQPIYLRGVNLLTYFMLAEDGTWYTEGEGAYKFPSPDTDIPVVLTPKWENWFNEAHYLQIASTGFNVVRLPLTYRIFEDNGNPGQYKQKGWDFIDKHISWAKKHGVYMILDMHIPAGGCQPCGGGKSLWKNSAVQKRFRDLWVAIAKRYSNETTIAGYDLLNEPHPTSAGTDGNGDNSQWKTLAQQVSKDIRAVDKNHLLIVEAVNWVRGLGNWTHEILEGFQFLIDDNNAMYDIHFYFPFDYLFGNLSLPYPSSKKVRTIDGREMPFDKKYLEAELQIVIDFATTNNVPMNFGEWSATAIRKSGGLTYISDLVSLYDKYGLHWNFWNYANFYNGKLRQRNIIADRIKIFEDYFNTSPDFTPPSPPKNIHVTQQ